MAGQNTRIGPDLVGLSVIRVNPPASTTKEYQCGISIDFIPS
jgi:hypothetical protein